MIVLYVYIATHNRKDFFKHFLKPLFVQTDRDFKVLIVDNRSTDAFVDSVASLSKPITGLCQQSKEPATVRNIGMGVAKRHYVTFLETVDICFSSTFRTYRAVIPRSHDPAALIIAVTQPFRFESALEPLTLSEVVVEPIDDFFASSRVSLWYGANVIAVQAVQWRTSGGFISECINAEDRGCLFRLCIIPSFAHVLAHRTLGCRVRESNAMPIVSRTLARFRG